jgi:O-methyltransferase
VSVSDEAKAVAANESDAPESASATETPAQTIKRLRRSIDGLKEKLSQAREKSAGLNAQFRDSRDKLNTLRRSYYLAGSGRKIDISALPGFSTIASQVMAEGRAGMNFDRLYTLWQAVSRAPEGFPIVEVGSYKGGSSKFIAEAFRRVGRSPHFYVCDTFSGHARLDAAIDGVESDDGFRDTSPESVREYLAGYPNVELVVGDIFETSARLSDPAYGFVHIDVDVYPPTAFCLDFFSTRLAPGAWMVVDDYGVVTCPGAQKAVDDFVRDNPGFSRVHLLSAQAVLFRAG